MKLKTKAASNNVICVFGDYEDVSVHLANIDFRTNRIYTTGEGAGIVFPNEFLENHSVMYFDENCMKRDMKFNACIDFQKDETQSILTMCNR